MLQNAVSKALPHASSIRVSTLINDLQLFDIYLFQLFRLAAMTIVVLLADGMYQHIERFVDRCPACGRIRVIREALWIMLQRKPCQSTVS